MSCLLMASISSFAQINTDQVMRVGRNALYFEDYMVAIRYFNQVIGAKPYLAQPYFYRAIAKLSLDDYAGAEDDATIAIKQNPFITEAYEVRGVARQNLGKNFDAIDDYNRLLSDDPYNRNVLYNKALAEEDVKDYAAAETTFNRLLRRYPKYDGGYIARAKLGMVKGDTIAALADVERAIELNPNATNAYIIRAEIKATSDNDPQAAIADMDMAIRLQPRSAGLYINRACLRYKVDDYQGAMLDFGHALAIEPLNIVALYNRGLLRAEIHDNNNAIEDFTGVLNLNPRQYRALFNRANLYRETGAVEKALDDINKVIEAFPTFADAYFMRAEIQNRMGRHRAAESDYRRSIALAKKKVEVLPDSDIGGGVAQNDTTGIFGESQQDVSLRFSSLLEVDNLADNPKEYGSKSTRGHIQDTDFAIQLEPVYTLSFYSGESELHPGAQFLREVDALNESGALSGPLYLVCHESALSDESSIRRHFNSVEYQNAWLATHPARAVDYFSRAMDFMMLRDYDAAITDFDRAVEQSPDFSLAFLMRSVARWKNLEARDQAAGKGVEAKVDAATSKSKAMLWRAEAQQVIDDLDRVIALSPSMAVAYYNRGCVYAALGDYNDALSSFSSAISLKPDMGEAFFNRGYINMLLGDKAAAFSDLSAAGELGIVPAYSLIKRMSR